MTKNVMITLISKKPGELKEFLNKFYAKEIINEDGAFKWSCFFYLPYESIEILSTTIDNNEKYKIDVFVTLNQKTSLEVNEENIEEIVKLFLSIRSGDYQSPYKS